MNEVTTCIELIAPRFGLTLVHSLWQGAAIAVALAVLLRFFRSASASSRYLFCCAALALFAIAVAATFVLLGGAEAPPVQASAVQQARLSHPNLMPVIPVAMGRAAPLMHAIDPILLAGYAWIIGACVVALWHLAGWSWVCLALRGSELDPSVLSPLAERLGVHRSVRLRETLRGSVPGVVGAIWPVILVPLGLMNDLPPAQMQAILLHELAHIRRHDYLVNVFQAVIESLLFYHPATWWISARIRQEREHCCDDIAASMSPVRTYAAALLALEERRSPAFAALVAATGGTLLERVRRLLRGEPSPPTRPLRSAAASLVTIACILVPIAIWGCNKSPSGANSQSESSASADSKSSAIKFSPIVDADIKPDERFKLLNDGDLVSVTVGDLMGPGADTIVQARINDPDGTIDLPMLSQLRIAGLTETEAETAIVKAYADHQIIRHTAVAVVKVEDRANVFTILGYAAKTPGQYEIPNSDFRLSSALVMAGARLAGVDFIVVTRKADKSRRILKIPVARLLAGDQKVNLVMRRGDLVFVPPSNSPDVAHEPEIPATRPVDQSEYYYIAGDGIPRVGVYSIPREKVTLTQAIIAAGGTDKNAYISVRRRDKRAESPNLTTGESHSVVVENARYSDLSSGAVNDLFVQPNDIIRVTRQPEHWRGVTTTKTSLLPDLNAQIEATVDGGKQNPRLHPEATTSNTSPR